MAMSNFEKLFVNREGKGRRNVAKVKQRLEHLDTSSIHDVLEIGCGIGTVSAFLSENYPFRVTGTDYDPDQIIEAKKLHLENDKLQFRVEDGANLSFDNASMDLVIAQNVFHHIPNWKEGFREVHRILRPNGHLFWLDIVFLSPLRSILHKLDRNESFFSIDEIIQESRNIGFSIKTHERMYLLLFTQHHFVFQK